MEEEDYMQPESPLLRLNSVDGVPELPPPPKKIRAGEKGPSEVLQPGTLFEEFKPLLHPRPPSPDFREIRRKFQEYVDFAEAASKEEFMLMLTVINGFNDGVLSLEAEKAKKTLKEAEWKMSGYTSHDLMPNNQEGYAGIYFVNKPQTVQHRVVICHRGQQFPKAENSSDKDTNMLADVLFANTSYLKIFDLAIEYANAVCAREKQESVFTHCGAFFAGKIATVVAYTTRAKAVVFECPGVFETLHELEGLYPGVCLYAKENAPNVHVYLSDAINALTGSGTHCGIILQTAGLFFPELKLLEENPHKALRRNPTRLEKLFASFYFDRLKKCMEDRDTTYRRIIGLCSRIITEKVKNLDEGSNNFVDKLFELISQAAVRHGLVTNIECELVTKPMPFERTQQTIIYQIQMEKEKAASVGRMRY